MACTERVSVVIPTYGRERVLVETLEALFVLDPPAVEILVVDQTLSHEPETAMALDRWSASGKIRWLLLPQPSTTHAMNVGLMEASGDIVLFLDDDIVPSEGLVLAHSAAYDCGEVVAVVGQVLQPGEEARDVEIPEPREGLLADLGFPFYSNRRASVKNAIGCNLSVRRDAVLKMGGFDERFIGSAYRFETEFARRVWRLGGRVLFEPKASIRHLKAASGGTRSRGGHMTSASPLQGAGDYYFALRQGMSFATLLYILKRPFREVRSRFHLRHPWWIPVKFIGELRALLLALRMYRQGPRYMVPKSVS